MTWTPLALSLQVATIAMVVSLIVSAPLVLPPTVLGFYLFTMLGPDSAIGRAWRWLTGDDLVFSFKAAVIAASVGSLPLVVRAVRVGLEAVEPNLLAAARTLGASPMRVLATVRLPLAAPGIAAGAMLGFARALGDYGMTQVVAGARFDGLGIRNTSPASIYTYDQFIAGHDDAALAMAIATTIVGVTILYFANRLTRRLHRV